MKNNQVTSMYLSLLIICQFVRRKKIVKFYMIIDDHQSIIQNMLSVTSNNYEKKKKTDIHILLGSGVKLNLQFTFFRPWVSTHMESYGLQ